VLHLTADADGDRVEVDRVEHLILIGDRRPVCGIAEVQFPDAVLGQDEVAADRGIREPARIGGETGPRAAPASPADLRGPSSVTVVTDASLDNRLYAEWPADAAHRDLGLEPRPHVGEADGRLERDLY